MKWLPIETAPKDGTWVLLTGGSDYGDDHVGPCVVAFWDLDCWVYAYWDGQWRSAYENPTDWIPLSALPQ